MTVLKEPAPILREGAASFTALLPRHDADHDVADLLLGLDVAVGLDNLVQGIPTFVNALTMRQRFVLISACAPAFGDSYCSFTWAAN